MGAFPEQLFSPVHHSSSNQISHRYTSFQIVSLLAREMFRILSYPIPVELSVTITTFAKFQMLSCIF